MDMTLVALSVVASTLMWPVNRWALAARPRGETSELYGFWIGSSGALLAAVASLVWGQRLDVGVVWLIGALVGVAFGFGYCIALMRCLAIGPLGPSAVVNNMGMLWPVFLGALWLDPHPLSVAHWTGLGLVVAALAAFGFSRPSVGQGSRGASAEWALWALLTWVAAGISMTAQLAASIAAPSSPLPLACAYLATGAAFLLPFVLIKRERLVRRREMLAGAANGTLQVVAVASQLVALRTLGPEVVFPFAVGLPVILALLLGRVVYRERIDPPGWIATALGTAGLVTLATVT